jgi:hypothetical protein
MGKKKKRRRDCHNCEDAMYIGEGDYICDGNPTSLVIADWIPTEDFAMCNHNRYTCPKCENADHPAGAKFCKICGDKINK